MKRSEINRAIEEAIELFHGFNYRLPPWAYWSPEQWQSIGSEADQIRHHGMGWVVTDFGSGDFDACGLTIFVAQNGLLKDGQLVTGQSYAQKVFLIRPGQLTPYHFHWMKTESLLNQAGGRLEVNLAWPNKDERTRSSREVTVQVDGITRRIPSEGLITLEPGQSVLFPPMLAHQFRGRPGDGKVFAGELSTVNDDSADNCFFGMNASRTPLEEDVPPSHLMLNEYPAALVGAGDRLI